ncbi:hypothetical protein [Mycobacterium sp. M23085]|uniref:PPW family C-terminal domain-containing PPE protein n=1 Tax=Mycobacterium sp. M23085 TaxID=3378087 RepID=UPI003877C6FB
MSAGSQGAGALGVAAATVTPLPAAGLTTLESDAFGGAPTLPMMPHSWRPDSG